MAAASNVQRVMNELDRFASRVITLIAVEITSNLIGTTPVDTGWARANWLPSVRAPRGSPAGSRESVSSSAQASGLAQLKAYRLNMGSVFIANNVPYIGDLNNGTSRKAPAGFVQSSILRGVAVAASAAAALGATR